MTNRKISTKLVAIIFTGLAALPITANAEEVGQEINSPVINLDEVLVSSDEVLEPTSVITEEFLNFPKVEQPIKQNIIALTSAMEKVKNPIAKAALQRNIEKTYAKLAKKLAKMENKEIVNTSNDEAQTELIASIPAVEPTTDTGETPEAFVTDETLELEVSTEPTEDTEEEQQFAVDTAVQPAAVPAIKVEKDHSNKQVDKEARKQEKAIAKQNKQLEKSNKNKNQK